MEKETRVLDVELRVKRGEEKTIFSGTPIVYNRDSADMGFIERISPWAAKEAINSSDIRLLYGHNSDSLLPLARTSSGTLRAVETENGIEIEADAPDTQFAKDLAVAIERGDVSQMSFTFTVDDDTWEEIDGKYFRTVNKIKELYDFSFVAFPAYPDTTAAMRSLNKNKSMRSHGELSHIAENEDIDINLILSRYEDTK